MKGMRKSISAILFLAVASAIIGGSYHEERIPSTWGYEWDENALESTIGRIGSTPWTHVDYYIAPGQRTPRGVWVINSDTLVIQAWGWRPASIVSRIKLWVL